jgi:hypothetical protein
MSEHHNEIDLDALDIDAGDADLSDEEVYAKYLENRRYRSTKAEVHWRLRVPVDRDHRFRRKVITGSGGT